MGMEEPDRSCGPCLCGLVCLFVRLCFSAASVKYSLQTSGSLPDVGGEPLHCGLEFPIFWPQLPSVLSK